MFFAHMKTTRAHMGTTLAHVGLQNESFQVVVVLKRLRDKQALPAAPKRRMIRAGVAGPAAGEPRSTGD